jgi:hypothetical protein
MLRPHRWVAVAVALVIGVSSLAVVQNPNAAPPAERGAPSPACRDEQGLSYICQLLVSWRTCSRARCDCSAICHAVWLTGEDRAGRHVIARNADMWTV